MKLKFKQQAFQSDAVNTVVDLFRGQEKRQDTFTIVNEQQLNIDAGLGVGNVLTIGNDQLIANMQEVQKRHSLPLTADLMGNHFSIEMETGTGKTYVYTKTIFELHKQYGFTKFIVVVPSVAIREGVYKSFQITAEHFAAQYDNTPVRCFIYDSKKLSQVRLFATSSDIEIMIINIDAFKKSENIINQEQDRLNGETAMSYIQDTHPIVIIDEPQSVDNTPKAKHGEDAMRNCAASFIADGKLNGYLAYVDGISIGWCNADDKSNYRRLETESFFCGNSAERVKAITCFEIAPEYRGKGIATALLERVISDAKDEGYGFVESYPHLHNQHDPFDYAGPIRLYEKAGFAEVARNGDKIVMIKEITVTEETNEERQARIYPIILSEYNFAWPEWYAEEKASLERLIGIENIARISHFGSTSVPGLMAKPTVDILLEIKENTDIEKLISVMPDDEYICLRQQTVDSPDCVMFLKGYLHDGFASKVFHIHVRHPSDWDELYFRDYLISHPEAVAEYAELKRGLFKDYEHNRDGYTAAKGEFIRKVTEKARGYISMNDDASDRTVYVSNDILSLVEYKPHDDRMLYYDWLDPDTQRGYNDVHVTTFDEFQSREIRQRFFAMIRLDSDGEIIGAVGISPPETTADLAIWIFQPYRKRGYGTSAFALATKYAVDVLKIMELHAGVYPDNIGSQMMLKKCGYVSFHAGDVSEKHYITGEDIIQLDYIYEPFTIRLAVPSDAQDMAEVHMRSWEVAYKGILPDEYIREKNATRHDLYARVITEENETSYVIQYCGKTIGIMCVAPPQDKELTDCHELHYIYLHPDYFRRGIGTQAMEFACNIARSLRKTGFVLWVLEKNTGSIQFYKKCGFAADGGSWERNFDKPLRSIRMRKELKYE